MHFKQGQKFFWIIILVGILLGAQQILSTTSVSINPSDLIINEFMAANRSGLSDADGDYSDWIEIFNQSQQAINLAGWSLTDDPHQPEKWTFPDVTLGSHTYLVVFASGKNRQLTQPAQELHTNFKLNQKGEFLGLYNIFRNQFMDVIPSVALFPQEADVDKRFPEQFADIPYGRYHNAANTLPFGYLATATPGQPNDQTPLWAGLVASVDFSQERGFYEAPITVALTTPTPKATIRYTTDGSEPTETRGTLYTAPLAINTTSLLRAAAFRPNFRPSPVETHTYIFLDDVLTQPKVPPGFPKTWGGYEGTPVDADYEMDPAIVNDPRYRPDIKAALTAIPTISIVTDMQNFHDLYANPQRRGRAWERPVSVEFFDPSSRQPSFQIKAGLRIQGELGRLEFIPKHGFRLFFRGEYGATRLEYPLFPDSPVAEFDTLILRSGVNRSYAGLPERENEVKLTAYTRDEWLRASQIAMSGFGSHGIFVHLYLNGLYWGLYNVVERPDASFMSSYFGGTKDDWQTISHAEAMNNPNGRFKTLHNLVADGHLEDPERYATIKSYLNMPGFIDYLILNWYVGNLDWAFNNWYAGVPNSAGQINYFVWDGERIWFDGAEIFMEMDEYRGRPNLVKPLCEALLENPDFRMELADRLYKHLFNDGALSKENSQARWMSINNLIEQAIIGESARWGDTRFDPPLTQDDWFKARDDVLAQMEGNSIKLIALAREAGYYPDLEPPLFNQHGGLVSAKFRLTMTAARGTIYYTTDGIDPRGHQSGAVAPNARTYRHPLVLTTTTQIKARVLEGHTWSALHEATFRIAEPDSQLRITELMYNPTGGDDYEFIELKNTGDTTLSLANISLEGVRFTFPPNARSLAPGELVVLVRNPLAFKQRYPGVTIDGVYDGQLSNKGEKITLKYKKGNILVSLEYDDENGWPVSSDGGGDSLVFTNLNQDPSNPKNWRASPNRHGSPGTDDP